MDLYHVVLFVHVVAAILLVGGSAFAHVVGHFARRATTVEGLRIPLALIHAIVKVSMPLAMVVLAAGLYLAFDGSWWGGGWPVVALVLFTAVGATAGRYLDPTVSKAKETLDAASDGPVPAEVTAVFRDRTFGLVTWGFAGADLAIVYLMTNKPGYVGSVVTAVICLALAAGIALREGREEAVTPATATPSA